LRRGFARSLRVAGLAPQVLRARKSPARLLHERQRRDEEMDGEQPIGIGAWVDWVIKQGVPFAVPGWGIDSGQWGSGDRSQFIRDMYAAFKKAHQSDSGLAMQLYFDGGTTFSCWPN
jgi:hypothetical protein